MTDKPKRQRTFLDWADDSRGKPEKRRKRSRKPKARKPASLPASQSMATPDSQVTSSVASLPAVERTVADGPTPATPTSSGFDTLVQHFCEVGYRYRSLGDDALIVTFGADIGTVDVLAWVPEERGLFHVTAFSPILIPEGCRRDVAEAIVRANSLLAMERFELDFENGRLMVRVSQIIAENPLTPKMIDRLMNWALCDMERFLPGFLSVVYGNELPQDAIRQVMCGPTSP